MTKPQLSAKELGLINLIGDQAREHVVTTNKDEYGKYRALYFDIIADMFTGANEILTADEKELVTFTAIASLTTNHRNFHFLLHTDTIRSRIAITIRQQYVPIGDTTAFKKSFLMYNDIPASTRWITSVCLSSVSLAGEVAIDGSNVWYAANNWWLCDGEGYVYYGLADCDTAIDLISKVVDGKNLINMILGPGV